ncbi:MAG: alanine--tRNA ligase, partial [Ignavibacteriales bacterium]|nr:alanine--tRNA ligase [Ignavibacteriales bacterium]
LMKEQKNRAREATREKLSSLNIQATSSADFNLTENTATTFLGYENLSADAKIIGHKKEQFTDLIILNQSPFYVEAGGQIDDTGYLTTGDATLEIVDVAKIEDKTIHVVKNEHDISLATGFDVRVAVDRVRRWDIQRNHSATHFLHACLRKIVGTHVQQAGSYVGPDHLRFDFSHFAKLSETEIFEVEQMLNEELRKNHPLHHHRAIPFEEAKKMGALMFFGDKYGDNVNVVQFGNFSMEFCGGTHVHNSSEIGLFKIISENSIASGIRRIEAVTGKGVEGFLNQQLAKVKSSEARVAELAEEKKKLEKDIADLHFKDKLASVANIAAAPTELGNISLYKGKVAAIDTDELKKFGDELRNRMSEGVGLLVSEIDGKVGLVCVVTDNLIKEKKLSAGKIVGDVAKLLGGGGGGKQHLATAGAKDVAKIDDALRAFDGIVIQYVG